MPIYLYQNPETEEVVEVLQGMNDEHTYRDEMGLKWTRLFTSPNASFDTQVDPFSKSDYCKATTNKKGTVGDLMDYSKELSQERASKNGGVDPIAEKFYSDHEKNTGKKHPTKAKTYESKNVKVEYD